MPMLLPAFMFGRVYGCASLLVLVIDVYAILQIVESRGSTARKVIWILLVVFFPLGGALLWLLFGRR
jgi:hypothetical protein